MALLVVTSTHARNIDGETPVLVSSPVDDGWPDEPNHDERTISVSVCAVQ